MFLTIFSNVSILFLYMVLGYLLCKAGKATASHAKSLSGILIYILSPAMLINSFLQIDFSAESVWKLGRFFLVTLAIQMLFLGVLYLVFHKKYENAAYRILTIGGVLGNVGFIGMPVVSGIFPNDPIVSCYSSINVMSMNLLVFTVGIYMITYDRKYISVKGAILNPTTLSILAALPLYVFGIHFPGAIENAMGLLGKMVTPMCMFILGIRLSTARVKDLFSRPLVYLACIFKLVAFPVFAFLVVRWLPFLDPVAKAAVFILAATPAGAVIEAMSEFHECEQELSANVVLLTSVFSMATMPVVIYLLMLGMP